MRQSTITTILNQHGIVHTVLPDLSQPPVINVATPLRIHAQHVSTKDDQVYTDWLDVTDWKLRRLMAWLGY